MTTAEKLAKLRKQLDLARAMVNASDPRAGEAEQRVATTLVARITSDMNGGNFGAAARAATELRRAVLNFQASWARGESSATGRVLTQVETLAAEIETELRTKAAGG
jgi:hypothetical protein